MHKYVEYIYRPFGALSNFTFVELRTEHIIFKIE